MILETKKLDDVCDVVRGGSPRPIKKYITTSSDGLNWIKISDATASDKYIFKTKQKIKKEGALRSRIVKKGDLILSNSMSFGRPYIMKTTGCVHDGWLVLSNYQSKLNVEYFYYLLSSPYIIQQFEKVATGSTVRNLNISLVKNIQISFPSLEEQQHIVGKLDAAIAEIDKALTVAEDTSKTAEMLFQNYLTEVFKGSHGWVEKSIDEMTDKTTNVNPNKSPNIQFKYVDVSSVSNKEFVITETQLLFGKDAPSRAKKNIITNDIIFATVRPTLKRLAIVPKELENQVASTGYAILRTNKSNHYKFLFYFLLSNIFMKAMNSLQRGASYPAVSDMDVKSQRLKVPNYQEQIKIVEKLDVLMLSVDSIIKVQNKKMEELNLLKQSILQQTLTKKLIKAA